MAAGVACGLPGCTSPLPVRNASVFCFGSATKLLTAVAVLRHVELGLLQLDDLAEPLIDRFLRATGADIQCVAQTWRRM